MRKPRTALFFISLVTLVSAGIAIPQRKNSVSGKVLDKQDKAIAGVDVEAYRQSLSLGRSHTRDDGEYSIGFDAGTPIDTVRYDHVDWLPAKVEYVSGSNDEKIFKTLHSRTANLDYLEIHEVLSVFDRIQELDLANNSLKQNLDKYKYQGALERIQAMIEKLNVPPDARLELRQRLATIKKRYGIVTNLAN